MSDRSLLNVRDVHIAQKQLREVKELLAQRQQAKLAQARVEQDLAAKAGRESYFLLDGETTLRVHPYFYHRWGRKLGYACWSDPQFIREFIRDNECVRVKNRSKKPKFGYQAPPRAIAPSWLGPSKKRFHKSYGAVA